MRCCLQVLSSHYCEKVLLQSFTDSNSVFLDFCLKLIKPSLKLLTFQSLCFHSSFHCCSAPQAASGAFFLAGALEDCVFLRADFLIAWAAFKHGLHVPVESVFSKIISQVTHRYDREIAKCSLSLNSNFGIECRTTIPEETV